MTRPPARKAPGRRSTFHQDPPPASSLPRPTPSPYPPPTTPANSCAITAEPHVAGTPADYKTAVFVRDKLRDWGWKADLAELEVLLNYPQRNPTLALNLPSVRALSLDEAPVVTDKDSASTKAFGDLSRVWSLR